MKLALHSKLASNERPRFLDGIGRARFAAIHMWALSERLESLAVFSELEGALDEEIGSS